MAARPQPLPAEAGSYSVARHGAGWALQGLQGVSDLAVWTQIASLNSVRALPSRPDCQRDLDMQGLPRRSSAGSKATNTAATSAPVTNATEVVLGGFRAAPGLRGEGASVMPVRLPALQALHLSHRLLLHHAAAKRCAGQGGKPEMTRNPVAGGCITCSHHETVMYASCPIHTCS